MTRPELCLAGPPVPEMSSDWSDPSIRWMLVYTKPHAEAWAAANLANQGFRALLPRVSSGRGAGLGMLFPRYLFVGAPGDRTTAAIRSTYGVAYVVHCGDKPAVVPVEVIADIAGGL